MNNKSLVQTKEYATRHKPIEGLFKTLSNNLPIGVYIVQDGRFVFANPQFLVDMGLTEDELIGTTSLNYIHPEDRERVKEETIKRLKGELSSPYEFRTITKDGETRVIMETMASIQYEGERAALGSHIDITERKYMEEKLLESEGFSSSLLENAPNPIVVIHPDTTIKYVNPAFEKLTGFASKEVIGTTTPYPWWLVDSISGDLRDFKKHTRTGVRGLEMRFRKKSGKQIWVTLTSVPVKYDEQLQYSLENWVDITERKRIEAELEKAYLELKETTAQLVQNEKMRALGELTSGIAHELNQPLNNVKIVCDSLLRDIEKDRLEMDTLPHDLRDMVEQVNKMAGIIDHMRVFTRRVEGNLKDEIFINDPVNNLFVLLGEQMRVHDIEVIMDLAPDLPKVMADPIGLEQVFVNIINNARNAVENFRETGKRIEIISYLNNEKEVAVSIKDNGGGMPANVRERIFEPFFTTKPPGQGTGLGLSITRKIVQEQGGSVELEVEEGEGSTFTVILPVIGAETGGE